MEHFESWGRHHRSTGESFWMNRSHLTFPQGREKKFLPYGLGRSYGDCCLNDGGILLRTRALNRILFFDKDRGRISCESGVTLDEILKEIVCSGWFLPASPGTKFVTVGGAIGNDVYGKNHPLTGSFGCHVLSLELMRSDRTRLTCSEKDNPDLFRATIGGLGLTGLITRAEIQLKKIQNSFLSTELIKMRGLDELLAALEESHLSYEYAVGWIDALAPRQKMGRGILLRANHNTDPSLGLKVHSGPLFDFPFDLPIPVINNISIKVLNFLYRSRQFPETKRSVDHYDGFFYPLDAIGRWNRVCGKKGFFQYQCVIPRESGVAPIKELFTRATRASQGSFLVNVRTFGENCSPGMLSFPRRGFGMELDYTNKEERTRNLFRDFDCVVREAGGRLNPSKDSCMGAEDFQRFFPRWDAYSKYIDPIFSSNLYRRVVPKG